MRRNAYSFSFFEKGTRHPPFLFSWLKPLERRTYLVPNVACRKYSTTSRVPCEGSICNCARCLFKPDLSAVYGVFFPGAELSKSVPGNSDLWVFTLCGKGLLLHQLRPKVWWKLGSFAGDLSPLVSWRWLFGAVCVWTINLHQAPAQTGTDRKYTVSLSPWQHSFGLLQDAVLGVEGPCQRWAKKPASFSLPTGLLCQ